MLFAATACDLCLGNFFYYWCGASELDDLLTTPSMTMNKAIEKKDGSLYTEEATISLVFHACGAIVNYIAVKLDIREKLHIAAEKENWKDNICPATRLMNCRGNTGDQNENYGIHQEY